MVSTLTDNYGHWPMTARCWRQNTTMVYFCEIFCQRRLLNCNLNTVHVWINLAAAGALKPWNSSWFLHFQLPRKISEKNAEQVLNTNTSVTWNRQHAVKFIINIIPRRELMGPPCMLSINCNVAPLHILQSCKDCSFFSSLECHTKCCWDAGMPVITNEKNRVGNTKISHWPCRVNMDAIIIPHISLSNAKELSKPSIKWQ